MRDPCNLLASSNEYDIIIIPECTQWTHIDVAYLKFTIINKTNHISSISNWISNRQKNITPCTVMTIKGYIYGIGCMIEGELHRKFMLIITGDINYY